MPENAVVGSLSLQRLQAMLEVAAPVHPKMRAEIEAMGVPAAAVLPEDGTTTFVGPRTTARSAESWDPETVVRALREVSREVEFSKLGEGSLVTVRNLEPSLAQAALTEIALERGWAKEAADGRVEWVQFGALDPGWIEAVLQRIKALFTGRAHRPRLPATPDRLPSACKLLVVGDWGTGLYGAPEFTKWASPTQTWDAVVHLGDTYYAGTDNEVKKRLKANWPQIQSPTSATLSRFLNGNHEMYSGGRAYFSFIVGFQQQHPQTSSCFALQNDDWLIVGLDTSWHGFKVEPAMQSGHLDDDQIGWLTKLVQDCGDRHLILMSHHQPFHFTGSENAELTIDLQPLWDTQKVRIWYWGHEHFAVRYAKNKYGFEGRCLGHGGIPEARRAAIRNSPQSKPIPGTQCSWKGLTTNVGAQPVQSWVLDGPNPLVAADPDDFSPHGWAVLRLDGPNLVEDWYLADGAVLLPLP